MHGVQVPNISTRDDAIQLVKFAKYPPWGMRGFSPYTKAGLYDFSRGTEMPHLANNNTLVIANVEGTEGIKNLPAICSVANLDIVFIGLFDLSKSLGLPGQVEHPDVLEALEGALDTIKQNGKYSGSIASNFRMLDKLKGYDIDYVTYSVDTGMLKETYQKVVSAYSE
jgi:4-hydroxy-2-oxoheptanedioate aldolase